MGRLESEKVADDSEQALGGAQRKRRRSRDRQATEAELLAAARDLLDRDGVLAGLNLREVAERAGVNRGQIYQYFGSRRDLLRAALGEMAIRRKATFDADQPTSFATWRRSVFDRSLHRLTEIRLAALLALDGETHLKLFPARDEAVAAARASRSHPSGLRQDADAVGALVGTASAYLGYAIFRDAFADEFNLSTEELDALMAAAYDRMLDGFCTTTV